MNKERARFGAGVAVRESVSARGASEARRSGFGFGFCVDLEKEIIQTDSSPVYAAIACFVVPYAPPIFRFF